jgi:hypothetical protein
LLTEEGGGEGANNMTARKLGPLYYIKYSPVYILAHAKGLKSQCLVMSWQPLEIPSRNFSRILTFSWRDHNTWGVLEEEDPNILVPENYYLLFSARIYRPSFRENNPKLGKTLTLYFVHC